MNNQTKIILIIGIIALLIYAKPQYVYEATAYTNAGAGATSADITISSRATASNGEVYDNLGIEAYSYSTNNWKTIKAPVPSSLTSYCAQTYSDNGITNINTGFSGTIGPDPGDCHIPKLQWTNIPSEYISQNGDIQIKLYSIGNNGPISNAAITATGIEGIAGGSSSTSTTTTNTPTNTASNIGNSIENTVTQGANTLTGLISKFFNWLGGLFK